MGVDPLSPIAPARLKALLLPVGKIKRSRFLGFAARLQADNVVRLGDISPDGRPNRNMFSPLAFPTGMIFYDLTFSVPPISHLDLFPFEIFREPLVIIAIADGTELSKGSGEQASLAGVNLTNKDLPSPEGLDQLLAELSLARERNPRALVHQLVVFDYEGVDKIQNGPGDVLWVPRPQASKATTMKTVLCDITSLLLCELDEFAKVVQTIPLIESPKASSWGPRRGPELRPRPVDKLLHRMTMPTHLPSDPNALPGLQGRSSQSSPAPSDHETPTTFDEITRSIQLTHRASAVGKPNSLPSSKEHSRDRSSVSGLTASDRTKNRIKGRSGVVLGTLYLQAGIWPDALKELIEAAAMARASSDYVWHAKALESILLCLLMFAWAGMDFQIPQICYPVAEKSSKSFIGSSSDSISGHSTPGNRIVSLQNLANLLPDLSNTILNLYNRAANITEEPLPQLIFSETVIRLTRLLVSVRTRDGTLDDNALKHIVMGEPLVPLHLPERPRGIVLLRKSELTAFLFRALPLSPGSDLPATDAVPIMVGVVSVLNYLDLARKKAFILREFLSILVPNLVQARKIGAAEIGIHPAAGLSSLSNAAFDINALEIGTGNVEESLRALLANIGGIFGVQPSSFTEWEKSRQSFSAEDRSTKYPEYDSIAAIVDRSFRHAALDRYGDMNLKIDVLKACINCCEALPDFHGVLQFTVELLQTIRGDLMLSQAYKVHPCLPPDEQIRLLNNIKRTVDAGRKLGASSLEAEYWDDFLVRDIQLLPLSDLKRPVRRSKTDLDAVTARPEKSKDPFLYNPFSKPSSKAAELLMVAGETASFRVTLQNPYEFEVEIESLRFHTEGVSFDGLAENIVLPPLALQDVVVSAVAHGPGTVNILGCIVKVRHCRERRFPIFATFWRPDHENKVKRIGLAAKVPSSERPLSWSSTTSKDGKVISKKGPITTTCEVKVINKQPLLVIESMSLSQSAMMVLEGETKTFNITLHNTSACTLDFILFTFQDSTTRQLQSALRNKDLLPVEVYELELKLCAGSALRWRPQQHENGKASIAPDQTAIFEIDVLGKPGLQDAIIQIDYSSVDPAHDGLPEVFYTRQLFVPLTITVNASVEVARCDIFPFSGDFAWWNKFRIGGTDTTFSEPSKSLSPHLQSEDDEFSSVLSRLGRGSYGPDHCVILLELRNAWPNTVSVKLHVTEQAEQEYIPVPLEDKEGQYHVGRDLQPGQVSRFVLVLPRIYLQNPHAPIPLLNTGFRRQFVVSANKQTFESEAASREAFWYREELLKRLFGTWTEDYTGRSGTIDLRNLRLNARMVDAIRLEDIDVTFNIDSSSDTPDDSHPDRDTDTVVQFGRSKFRVKTDQMLNVTVTVHNRSSAPIHPLVRLQPSLANQPNNIALDLSRRLAWTGMLQQVLPILQGGQSAKATIGVTVLCRGEYELGASVEEVRLLKSPLSTADGQDANTNEATRGQASIQHYDGGIKDTFGTDVVKKRRIWHMKDKCVLNAHD
ncbi:hypothetical protein ASPZODRAFT_19106 [Penicilliopsis zonata CBS 506.65]|uniref:Hypercellular protein HypA n=1 Tax=Penicilliopsis zonata CBS 506.65 TaxID=1073090 RepID=A0A1L9S9G9_9EURO|nr:hypothetical protein ASPZODRAFT_19106 [Penicilliopsis zonata CBS 506.65]OJJ43803.1 hypothetical protein ASPZODRAFT_19106 [Penicilliopsis zonata CBS 506.65]